MNIYQIGTSNDVAQMCISDIDSLPALDRLHFESLSKTWEVLEFKFSSDNKKNLPFPDVASVMHSIIFRADLKDALFPKEHPFIEFLEIKVLGAKWFILNCLISTSKMDQKRSSFGKSINGKIFSIYKLILPDSTLCEVPCFTIDGSNRANLFVLDNFVRRFEALELKGLEFIEIGELEF